jgi:hypothetical protein
VRSSGHSLHGLAVARLLTLRFGTCDSGAESAREAEGAALPRYFFHLALEDQVILDSEGRELPDLSAARTRALAVARRMRAGSVVKAQTKAAFYIVGAISSLPLVVPFAEAAVSSGAEGQRSATGLCLSDTAGLLGVA